MKKRILWPAVVVSIGIACGLSAQTALFDFENASVHTSLPITLTVNGVTAHFTATGQGFAIQPANTMGFIPVGFSGNCIYPNSIYAADLMVAFEAQMTNFAVLYAPDELACDSSATMRVTAYLNGFLVGTTTTNAQAGTWPTETLQFTSTHPFNSVVIHYDKPPVTGGDYGVIFMADNVSVALAPLPIVLMNPMPLVNGGFYFSFTNFPGGSFTVYGTTNLAGANWTSLAGLVETSPGYYEFTDPTDRPLYFYRVSSP